MASGDYGEIFNNTMSHFDEAREDAGQSAREFTEGLIQQGFAELPCFVGESGGAQVVMADWYSTASAFARPEGFWLLDSLVNRHAMTFEEFESEKLGAVGAVALGQLMRAGYVVEGAARLHATDIGRIAYAEFIAKNPQIAAVSFAVST